MTSDDPAAGGWILRARNDGMTVYAGPVDVGQGTLLVDEYLAPHGWRATFIPLCPLDDAIRVWSVRASKEPPLPVVGADLFVALRRAIICDTDEYADGADDGRAQTLIAHLEQHRPVQLYEWDDEDCMRGECGHPDGGCAEPVLAARLCGGCSPVYDHGGDWGEEWLPTCQIPWPCAPVLAVAARYQIDATVA